MTKSKFTDGQIFAPEAISQNREKTPEGYLLCRGVTISKTGDFEYLSDEVPTVAPVDGRVIMTRPADELFRAETMQSFEGKPVVIGHDDFADPSNWSDVAVGIVTNVRQGEGTESHCLIADLLLTQERAIALVESGILEEVSCGYDAQAIDDGDGRGHQAGIVGNHIALVKRARCGSSCRIKDGFMKPELIEKLRALFAKGDKEAFEAALAELATTDGEANLEDAEQADPVPASNEEQQDEEPTEEQQDEVPPVEPEKSVEERLAVLEHEYQELGEKLAKLLDVEKAEGHEELQDEQQDEDPEAGIASTEDVREALADAEEICPDMKTPVGDSANGGFTVGALNRIKRKAIRASGVTCFGDASKLSGDALDVALKACVKIARIGKNPTVALADSKPQAVGLNARNAAFWKRG